jgi:coatomer subunit beta'
MVESRTNSINVSVKTAKWIGDCFVYTNSANRLNYLLGTQTSTVTQFETYVFYLIYLFLLKSF